MAKELFTEADHGQLPAGASADTHPLTLHRGLAHFNSARLAVASPTPQWRNLLANEMAWRLREGEFLEALREDVALLLPSAELDADGFMAWFENLKQTGPGQQHRLFKWLAHSATASDMQWFLRQKAAGEAGFDDLLAYTQVKLPVGPKLELARNYWDEMGHGKPKAMHGAMLATAVEELKLQPSIATTVWPALALANTMLGLAMSRRYTSHSLGALGVVELTAPTRVKLVSDGMRRLGMNGRIRSYFDLHAVLDVHHSEAWNREVIRPLVKAEPDSRPVHRGGCPDAAGVRPALLRLLCRPTHASGPALIGHGRNRHPTRRGPHRAAWLPACRGVCVHRHHPADAPAGAEQPGRCCGHITARHFWLVTAFCGGAASGRPVAAATGWRSGQSGGRWPCQPAEKPCPRGQPGC